MDDSLGLSTAGTLAAAIRNREISSRELLEMYLARVERINPAINAVVTLDADRAEEAATAADDALMRGDEVGPLHGLPVTIKDAIEVAGMRSTGGAAALADHIPTSDAPAVARVRQAGAVVFGKTNVPEWSGDVQTFNELFGTTNNPWDLSRTSGGSSGGPASAVSTGLTAFEIGTDIGGSIRIPSNWCGVFGHKPSFGVVSQRGYLDHAGGGLIDADINVFGPIARSAEDLELLLDVLAAPNADDAVAWSISLPRPRFDDISSYRVGLWLDDPFCSVDAPVLAALTSAGEALSAAGAKVSDVSGRPPVPLRDAVMMFMSLITPAISVSTTKEIGDAISGTHREWLDLHRARTLMRLAWADWFRDHDVLLCPVMPMAAFPHDHSGDSIAERTVVINGTPRLQLETLAWTGLVGVSYLPSTVVPVGRTPEGLPVGIQIVGPYLEDRTPLFVGAQLAELIGADAGGYRPPDLALR